MFGIKRFNTPFFIFILFINLFFVFTAQAQLTIGGNNQMSAGGSQTLTASGGCSGYSWSLKSGGGTLTGSDYTAPATNPNCENNPTICVTDSCGTKVCKQIAVNQYSNNAVAYQVNTCEAEGYTEYLPPVFMISPPYWRCNSAKIKINSYNCNGEIIGKPSYCSGICSTGCSAYDCGPEDAENLDCLGNRCGDLKSCAYSSLICPGNPAELDEDTDVRTEAQKAAGCCPAALLPPDEPPPPPPPPPPEPPPNDEGDNCKNSAPAESSANLKSGNLYHAQAVGKLTFSYNSIDTNDGPLGKKWTHNFNQRLTPKSDNITLVLNTDDGNIFHFRLSGGIYYPDDKSGDTSRFIKNADGTYTRTLKNGTVQIYSTAGKLTSITERSGKITTLAYTGNDLTSITDPNGRITTITTTSGKITSITNPAGQTYTLAYTGGLLTSIADPSGSAWIYTYDTAGRMLSKKDPANFTVTYTYDANGKILTSTDPEGKVRAMNYGPSGISTFTEKDGGLWAYKYDPVLVVITEKTDPLGNITSFTYDSKRNLVLTTYPDGTTTSNTYDANGNITSTTDALGNTTTYTYNEQNLVTSIKDAAGKITQYAYDAKGNVISITDSAGATTQYAYDAKGNITSITNPLSKTTTMAYDQYNNLISTTDPAGSTVTMAYDNLGNMTSQTDAAGKITTFQYNNLNQMIAVIDSSGKTTNYTYDAKGNILNTTDANGNKTTNTYNYKNQLIQTVDALGNITAFVYGGAGCSSCGGGTDKLTSITDAKNQKTIYEYNQTGKLIKETDPLGNVTSYAYDAKGNMISKTKPDGRTITYIYDVTGRLLEKRYPNNTADIFQYDQTGNVIMATTNQNIAYYYSYDAANRLTGVTDSNLHNIDYQYDAAGNRTAMTTPDGKTIRYEYNNNNQLTKILTNRGNYTFTYDALNRRIKRTLPNGTFTTYAYDQNSRLTDITHKNAHNKIIDSFSYTHDNVGNRITKTEEENTLNYSYDQIYRLTKAIPASKHDKGKLHEEILKHHTENYSYDPVGNRQAGPKANDSYTYNTGNELLTAKTHIIIDKNNQYEYDQNGNLIKKTETLAKGHYSIITTYAYDDENRLTEVKIQKGHKVKEVSFTYDPLGRRISKTVHKEEFVDDEDDGGKNDDNDKEKDKDKDKHGKPFQPRTTYYVYDNQNIIAEYDGNGKLVASYIHGPNIDEPLSAEIHNDWIYYHADGLGSITALTSHMGHAVQRYEYDSFGNMKLTPHWIKQPFTYTGREFDAETGLYYYRARYYDSKAGRFLQRDPILHPATGSSKNCRGGNLTYHNILPSFVKLLRNPQNLNPYAYVRNNPLKYIDPLGLACGSGWNEPIVPDDWGLWDFTGPCENHDYCYRSYCGVSKLICDLKFFGDMMGVCMTSGLSLPLCTGAATLYYLAVTIAAGPAYYNAQKEICDGCKK